MLIGILILSVLVVAAGILLFTTPAPDEQSDNPSISSPSPTIPDDETISVTGSNPLKPDPVETPEIDESPEPPPPTVRSVTITYGGRENTDFTAKVAEEVALRVRIEPVGIEEEIIWTTSDRAVFDVVPSIEGTAATVTGIGKGTATLTVTVGGVEAECIVRIK